MGAHLSGWDEATEQLEQAAAAALFSANAEQIRTRFIGLMEERFASQGGGSWPSDFVDKGDLRDSLTSESDPDFLADILDDQLELGTWVDHAQTLVDRYDILIIDPDEVLRMLAGVMREALGGL